jgi:histone-lysine N-methyltransferase SETD3
VLITYGQKSNSELLLLYGFVCDRNLFDEVELTISLSPKDPRYAEKEAFLKLQGLKTAMAFPLLIDRYSSELMEYLRICCLSVADGADDLESVTYNEPISEENEVTALNVLRDGCIAALGLYPETEAEDAKLMENGSMFAMFGKNARMAVKLRRNEKRILERTIRTVETSLERFGNKVAL